jgi:hypothetical protein
MSGPGLPKHRAVLAAVNTATRRYRGGLRPVLTAAARVAHPKLGRGGKTPPSRTEKHHSRSGPIILLNLTHTTRPASPRQPDFRTTIDGRAETC